MKYVIALSATPAQKGRMSLSAVECRYWLRQLATGLYLDLWIDGGLVLAGCLCQNKTDTLRGRAPEINGKLYFQDTQGNEDPSYSGLGSRFLFIFEDGT